MRKVTVYRGFKRKFRKRMSKQLRAVRSVEVAYFCCTGDGENVVTGVDKAAAPGGPHDDTARVRILTESGIILWRHQLLYDRLSRSFKKFSTHLVPLIKVEGLFAPYIVSIFDIVSSGTLV